MTGGGQDGSRALHGDAIDASPPALTAARLPLPAAASGSGTGPDRRPAPGGPGAANAPAPTTLLVIAKEPVPGRVKTRLTPPYRPEEAARLAEASLADTLETVARMDVRRRVLVLDGRPGPWLPAGFEVVPQRGGGLDERIAAAFGLCDGPALLIGMDTPQITTDLLALATNSGPWDERDAWFGPAADGGFWALGMARPQPELVLGVPMSRADTGTRQRRRLIEASLSVRDLPVLRDVDTAADAARVAELSSGRFASVHADLTRAVAP
ncbi:glycosyltransferase [Streptomyces bathyalis]|uniref:Glycosyltransferase n=1 Tax=Streptomyces bathyalis TaxID=2710756 RepID=A0A7T1T2D9_9ACTN|nr:TIGR04282 family arsenosugar biosynthesis glycosyltransferase [Streptomyces bathyalis]QPP05116.1 glycosyltransferase [Streptomyces bathyalis]